MLLAYFNGVVLQYDYLSRLRLALTRMQIFLWGTGFAFCFDIWRIIDQCSPNYSKKWNGKINGRIHVAQVCLRLAGACNETVYIAVRQHWSGRRLQLIRTEKHSHSLKSIFSSWSSPKMIEVGFHYVNFPLFTRRFFKPRSPLFHTTMKYKRNF